MNGIDQVHYSLAVYSWCAGVVGLTLDYDIVSNLIRSVPSSSCLNHSLVAPLVGCTAEGSHCGVFQSARIYIPQDRGTQEVCTSSRFSSRMVDLMRLLAWCQLLTASAQVSALVVFAGFAFCLGGFLCFRLLTTLVQESC